MGWDRKRRRGPILRCASPLTRQFYLRNSEGYSVILQYVFNGSWYKKSTTSDNYFMVLFTVRVPGHIFKRPPTINKQEKKSTFLYHSISDLAADTQCGLASSWKTFHHLASVYQGAGRLYSAPFQNVSLTSTQRRSQFSQQKENKIGIGTYLVECCYQQVFIFHTLPMTQAYTKS